MYIIIYRQHALVQKYSESSPYPSTCYLLKRTHSTKTSKENTFYQDLAVSGNEREHVLTSEENTFY